MNPEELEILAKKPSILAPPKEADVKQIDLGTGDPSKIAIISAHLSAKLELALTNFLWDNKDIFAWKPADMPGAQESWLSTELISMKAPSPWSNSYDDSH